MKLYEINLLQDCGFGEFAPLSFELRLYPPKFELRLYPPKNTQNTQSPQLRALTNILSKIHASASTRFPSIPLMKGAPFLLLTGPSTLHRIP